MPSAKRCRVGQRRHKPTGQCRTPCKKSHGPTWRRSPKGPYYKCIRSKGGGKKSGRKKSGRKKSKSPSKARRSTRSTKGVAAKRLDL